MKPGVEARMRKTMQVAPDAVKAIQNRVAPKGGRPDNAQRGAVLLANCAKTVQIANIKRATAPAKRTSEANRKALAVALAPQTAGARNAKRLAAVIESQSSKNTRRLASLNSTK